MKSETYRYCFSFDVNFVKFFSVQICKQYRPRQGRQCSVDFLSGSSDWFLICGVS